MEPENKKTQILQLLAELSGEEIKDNNGVIPGYETQVLTYLAAMSGEEIKDTGGVIPGFETQVLKHLAALAGGGGGGGGPTLLNTTSIGEVSTTSSTEASLDVMMFVEEIDDYDALLVVSSVGSVTNERHVATAALVFLTASSDIKTKTGGMPVTGSWNCRASSSGKLSTDTSSVSYGIYPSGVVSVADGHATFRLYRRYYSNATGTINGNYTARVYGIKLADLLGK